MKKWLLLTGVFLLLIGIILMIFSNALIQQTHDMFPFSDITSSYYYPYAVGMYVTLISPFVMIAGLESGPQGLVYS